MSFTFPSWYAGNFDDMEFAIKCLLEKHLEGTSPMPTVYAWLPPEWREKLPIIAIARVPGAVDEQSFTDTGELQVWAICESRADSWALAEIIRTILLAHCNGVIVDVGTHRVNIQSITRSEGPQLSMDDDRLSERLVPLSFIVRTRRRASLPDYHKVLKA